MESWRMDKKTSNSTGTPATAAAIVVDFLLNKRKLFDFFCNIKSVLKKTELNSNTNGKMRRGRGESLGLVPSNTRSNPVTSKGRLIFLK